MLSARTNRNGSVKNLALGITLYGLASFDLSRLIDARLQPAAESGKNLAAQIVAASAAAQQLPARYQSVQQRLAIECDQMKFDFLYSEKRKLFSIGFNAEIKHTDRNYYDMLASECRLSSYLAIAKGDVRTEHWFQLGRHATEVDGSFGLLSWGGTMFEYLMPPLFQRSYPDSVLDRSCMMAIRRQVQYGASKGAVWGTSESAYSARANNSDYLYKAFGVPGLGLKRGLSKDYVVSPYSSALAVSLFSERIR